MPGNLLQLGLLLLRLLRQHARLLRHLRRLVLRATTIHTARAEQPAPFFFLPLAGTKPGSGVQQTRRFSSSGQRSVALTNFQPACLETLTSPGGFLIFLHCQSTRRLKWTHASPPANAADLACPPPGLWADEQGRSLCLLRNRQLSASGSSWSAWRWWLVRLPDVRRILYFLVPIVTHAPLQASHAADCLGAGATRAGVHVVGFQSTTNLGQRLLRDSSFCVHRAGGLRVRTLVDRERSNPHVVGAAYVSIHDP